ncbi:MAG TPA: PASTA domain-containing protein [Balneolaceae bacterium]|nr:PASTA domain-containing protein [Balneolaceae bacterium]
MKQKIKETVTNKNIYIGIAAVIAAFVLLLILFNSIIMPWYTNYEEGLTVPNVTGIPIEKAKATLKADGLEYEVADRNTNELFPAGFVTDQQPRPAEIVKPDRKIYLTVNMKYHPTVEVPEVINLSFRSAKIQLQNSGLQVGSVSYESSRFKNTVLRQSIKADEVVEKGTKVDLAIGDGLGDRMVAVPDIIGMELSAAQQQLRRVGLRIDEVKYQSKQNVAPGTVIDFIPREERVVIGTTLKIIVAQEGQKSDFSNKTTNDKNE